MTLLNQMLLVDRFSEFIDELLTIYNDELNEKLDWEYYLHRVFDCSFEEFVDSQNKNDSAGNTEPTDGNIETTVKESKQLLEGFHLK